MMFAACAAALPLSSLGAQQLPARDLFDFSLGALAEAPALARRAGGGFWNPATVALAAGDRGSASLAALTTPIEQGISARLLAVSHRLGARVTGGLSYAEADVGDLLRTDTDPQSIGSEIPYRSAITSAVLSVRDGSATAGIALRRRTAVVDRITGRATSVDVGAVLERPRGLPFRAALSTFLLSPSRRLERSAAVAAVEGYLPTRAADARIGVSVRRDDEVGRETYVYASGTTAAVDLRGGVAREVAYGATVTRLRVGLGIRYARYLAAVARDEGTAGLGASYQFALSTVFR